MRLLLKILAGLVTLVVLIVIGVYAASSVKLGRRYTIADATPVIPADSASIARGMHLAVAIGKCTGCHRQDLGGEEIIPDGPFGRVASANLTSGRGGIGGSRTDAQLVNAIRHGVSHDGRPLILMPAEFYNRFSDEDVAAIVAYVRSVPPVDREHPPSKLGPIARALLIAGKLPGFIPALEIAHDAPRAPAPPAGVTAEYGEYLVFVGACRACHGPALAGGDASGGPPDARPSSNLTPEGLKGYDETAFIRALREGIRPSGTPIDTLAMPIPETREMTDDEIRAVWAYLRTVPSKPFGGK